MSEIAVKALQKEMLDNFEVELLDRMSPEHFNALRKLVFRTTFLAYRVGVLGIGRDETSYNKLISLGYQAMTLPNTTPLVELDEQLQKEVMFYCLEIWLESYRLGALSIAAKAV
jgi:hypothetical protein